MYRVVNATHHAVVVVINGQTFRFEPWEEKILPDNIINHPDFKRCETLRVVGVYRETSIVNEIPTVKEEKENVVIKETNKLEEIENKSKKRRKKN